MFASNTTNAFSQEVQIKYDCSYYSIWTQSSRQFSEKTAEIKGNYEKISRHHVFRHKREKKKSRGRGLVFLRKKDVVTWWRGIFSLLPK